MPTEITPPRISSKDMTPSQPIADVEVKTTRGKEAETQGQEQHVEHHPSPSAAIVSRGANSPWKTRGAGSRQAPLLDARASPASPKIARSTYKFEAARHPLGIKIP